MFLEITQEQVPVIIAIASTILILTFLKLFMRGPKPLEDFEWSIMSKISQKPTVPIFGSGVEKLLKHGPENFTYLSIWKTKLTDTRILEGWNLKFLNRLLLTNNKITSIESLCNIELPNLQVISLANNYLTSIRCMRKFSSANIIWIELHGNEGIKDLSSLSEMNLPYFIYFWIEFFENEVVGGESLNWLAKLEGHNLEKLHIKSSHRISQRETLNALKQKFVNLDFRVSED